MYSSSRGPVKQISMDSPISVRKTPMNSPDIRKKKKQKQPVKQPVRKASSFEDDAYRQNSARSLDPPLFGRIVRSSSAPRQRDLITATLEIPGVSRQSSKEDSYSENMMLESFNSLAFRTTFPSRKVQEEQLLGRQAGRKLAATMPATTIRVPSAERGKKRNNSIKSKIGPCKCKACTQKREAENFDAQENPDTFSATHSNKNDSSSSSNEAKVKPAKIKKAAKNSSNNSANKAGDMKLTEAKPAAKPTLKLKKANQAKSAVKGTNSPLKENNPIILTTEHLEKKKKAKTKGKGAKQSGKTKKNEENMAEKPKIAEEREEEEFQELEIPEYFEETDDDDVTLVPEDFRNFADLRSVKLEMDRSAELSFRRKKSTEENGDRCPPKLTVNHRKNSVQKRPEIAEGEETFVLHRAGTDLSCCSSFCFEEMKTTKPDDHTIATGDFGFLDFSKEMGGGFGIEREDTINLAGNDNNREVIKSRLGSRVDNTPSSVIQWKRGPMLGRGAFGTVWCGLTITGELIAVKQAEVIAMNTEKAQKEYEKIQGEVELLKSLNHPNIVGYLGTCLDGRVVSIFMQYIPGGSVAGILKKFGPLAEPIFARYTRQIVDGISYLHAKNVIHRDIKGSNLMLMPNGTVKLIDFGCAKKIMNLSSSNSDLLLSMKGTPYWMAPEVVNETGHGPKSDVWCVGCSVYEMALARPPWSHLNKYAALFAISSGNSLPKLSEKFSSEARNFVASCLIRNPEKRPTANDLLDHPFCRNFGQENSKIHDSSGVPRNSANRYKRL